MVVEVNERCLVDVAWVRVRDEVVAPEAATKRRGRGSTAEEAEVPASAFDSPDCLDVVSGAFETVVSRPLEDIVPERARPHAIDAIRRLGKLNDAFANESGITDALGGLAGVATPSAAQAYTARVRMLAQQLTNAKKLGSVTYSDIATFDGLVQRLKALGVSFHEDTLRARVLAIPIYRAFDGVGDDTDAPDAVEDDGRVPETLPGTFTGVGGFAREDQAS